MKIVVLDGYLVGFGGLSWEALAASGELVYYELTTAEDDIAGRIGDADVVLTNRCPLNGATIAACPNLKQIHSLGTGYNQIDLETANARGITVTNTPAYGSGAVAQMAVALLFDIVRRVSVFDNYVKTRGWDKAIDPEICGIRQMELTRKTLGIIGLGDIGYGVARVAMAMDMEVLAYRRNPNPELECDQLHFTDLNTLLEKSDIISIHCPLTDETRGMIDQNALAKMKEGAILLNTARGGVVKDEDVIAALDSGKLYAYGTDVFQSDPCGADNSLACHPRCVATPHVAWMPEETRARVIDIAAKTVAAYKTGSPIHVVNRPL